jgi:hypothetical protein
MKDVKCSAEPDSKKALDEWEETFISEMKVLILSNPTMLVEVLMAGCSVKSYPLAQSGPQLVLCFYPPRFPPREAGVSEGSTEAED